MSKSYQKLFEEAVTSIPERCTRMMRLMKYDRENISYPKRYHTLVEDIGKPQDCETLADLVSEKFPDFGVSYDITSISNRYHCSIDVESHYPRTYDEDYKKKLMHDVNSLRFSSKGTFNTSLFIPDETKCQGLAAALSMMSSRPDCSAFVKREF